MTPEDARFKKESLKDINSKFEVADKRLSKLQITDKDYKSSLYYTELPGSFPGKESACKFRRTWFDS